MTVWQMLRLAIVKWTGVDDVTVYPDHCRALDSCHLDAPLALKLGTLRFPNHVGAGYPAVILADQLCAVNLLCCHHSSGFPSMEHTETALFQISPWKSPWVGKTCCRSWHLHALFQPPSDNTFRQAWSLEECQALPCSGHQGHRARWHPLVSQFLHSCDKTDPS